MKVATHLDVLLNSIFNLVLEKLAEDPTVITQGRIYYNTTSNVIRYATGTEWKSVGELTGSDILTLLLNVDGEGSSLDADTVDGLEAAAFALAGHNHTAAGITDFATAVDARIMALLTSDAIDATVDTIAEFTALIKDNEADIANILSIKRYQEDLGDGTATDITVTHNLNSTDAVVQIIEVSTGETVIADVTRNGANSVVVGFAVAPAAGEYRAIILA